jgi:dipeptidyl aminopeptidase/acylaminoacyl peptidase
MILGSLPSIITSESLTTKTVRFSKIQIIDNKVYVCEIRPDEFGRSVIFSLSDCKDIFTPSYSAVNYVHEYGGRSYCGKDGVIFFTNKHDCQIYSVKDGKISRLTNMENIRFAEPYVCGNFLYAIFEDHKDKAKIRNGIIKIDMISATAEEMESSHDFYAGITFSKDGKYASFFTWDFPNMPWDASSVWKVEVLKDGCFSKKEKISKWEGYSSVDPIFSPSGKLYYVSDHSGFWNIYSEDGKAVYPLNADFSFPHFRMSNDLITFIDENTICCIYTKNAKDFLALIKDGKLETLDLGFTCYSSLHYNQNILYFIAGSVKQTKGVYSYDLTSKKLIKLKASDTVNLDSSWISEPEEISFQTRHGETCFAFYYPPKNPNYDFKGQKPPLILVSHGGPSSHKPPAFDLEFHYWTSRGFAVVDVNYSGSSGFGRDYRNRLYNNWGVKDVDDCEDCALYLVKEGLVDKNKLAVRGGSAGGYTTLCLLTFRDTFAAGASYFGLSDLELFVHDTHKFESFYLEKLVGPYPETKNRYQERSPIHFTDKLKKPILILQGDEDKIVPANQAEIIYKALMKKKIPTAYLLYSGEGHGFKKKENIMKSIDSELYFYQTIFGQKTTSTNPPLVIQNI